jgi:hypothetical protein
MQSAASQGSKRAWIAAIILILTTSALSYLILARQFGFYGDDWYLVYAGQAEGSWKYGDIFSIDRPFRAYFVSRVFDLFGLAAPLYSYLSYVLRVSGALGLFWLLVQVWPRHKNMLVLLAVLFGIYPGWTDQPAAFDYQSHLLGLSLLIWSFALMVWALRKRSPALNAAAILLAVGFQVNAFLQMEYYIGLEGLRLGLLLYVVLGLYSFQFFQPGWRSRLGRALLAWLPYLAGAAGFLFWRMVIFTSSRAATDIDSMFAGLAGSPLRRGLTLTVSIIQDFINITLMAWFVPVYQKAFNQDIRTTLPALAISLLAVGLVLLVYWWLARGKDAAATSAPDARARQDGVDMFWLGCLGVIVAIAPVALGDRHVVFPTFARFTLTGSIGAVMIVGGLLVAYASSRLRLLLPVVLIALSVMMHHSNAVQYAEDWAVMRNFWWQMSWRAPQIADGTVLAVEYPGVGIAEDYFIWGPANLVYYPERHRKDDQMVTPIGAVLLNPDTVLDVITGRTRGEYNRRTIVSPQDLGALLVVDQPTPGSCISVLDGRAPELSERARDRIVRVAPYSQLAGVSVEGQPRTPPPALFGPEPKHTWCYYYQKASLARQQGDWAEVVRLGDEIAPRDPHPAEWVEWMPFVQGYAYLGRYEQVDRIAKLYSGAPYLKRQACARFTEDVYGYGFQYPAGQAYLLQAFCEYTAWYYRLANYAPRSLPNDNTQFQGFPLCCNSTTKTEHTVRSWLAGCGRRPAPAQPAAPSTQPLCARGFLPAAGRPAAAAA